MDNLDLRPAPTQEQWMAIFRNLIRSDQAGVAASQGTTDQEMRVVTIDLAAARLSTDPYRIGFPFKSFYVLDATDLNVSVNFRYGSQDSFNDPITIRKGNFYKLPFPTGQAFLHWTAQSSKTITIAFFTRGEFGTNVQSFSITGGVNVSDGTSVSTVTTATVSTVAQLFAADPTRLKMMIINKSGLSIYLSGDVSVTDDNGVGIGIEVGPGDTYSWENTGACYAVSQGGVSTGQKIGLIKFS